jgi:phosphatidate cytidylyltransferase
MPIEGAPAVLVGLAILAVASGSAFALFRRLRPRPGIDGRTVFLRGASYAALALVLAAAVWGGTAGIAVLVGVIAAIALLEWSHLMDLPLHHRVALQIASVVIVASVAILGTASADWLIGGTVLVGIAWPVVPGRYGAGDPRPRLGGGRPDPHRHPARPRRAPGSGAGRARSHAVRRARRRLRRLRRRRVHRWATVGRHPLAPRLSPNKTREGVVGNVLGAAVGFLPFLVLLQPWFEPPAIVVLVLLVAVGSLWGDLLESAIKREAGVKDAAQWLPGFGGILDRIDSLLLVVPLVYWAMRVADVAR